MYLLIISKIGKPNANVLPDPVVASTHTSFIKDIQCELCWQLYQSYWMQYLVLQKIGNG